MSFFAVTLAAGVAPATQYFVAPEGADTSPGSRVRPFATVQKAADVMAPGDTCWVRGGTYRETVALKRSGQEGKPLRFAAYPGEVVTLSGTEPLECKWQAHQGSIYKTRVDRDFVQLFVDGEMMVEARWPNMRMEELWDRSKWAQTGEGSCYGKLCDPELAAAGADFTGALATLNVTHQFYTWTRPVTAHQPGQDYFEFPKDFGKSTEMRYGGKKTWAWRGDRYYLSGKLELLDAPTEWYLDTTTRTLYFWPADGRNPAGRRVEVKVRDYAFTAKGQSHVELEGFHFFGATFWLDTCHHCTVDNCHLRFPSYARELADLNPPKTRKHAVRTGLMGDYNTVRNSSLAFTPVSGFHVLGRQARVENCLVHDACWNGSLRYSPVAVHDRRWVKSTAPKGGVVRRCTVFNVGNIGIGFGAQPVTIELNHVYDGGLTCKDVALIYTGGPYCADSVVRYNWAHGCRTEEGGGLGIRGDDQTRKLIVHHNVVWDIGSAGIIVKGDHNQVHNNTVLYVGTKRRLMAHIQMPKRPEPVKPWRKQHPLLPVQNDNSQIFNNAARTVMDNRSKRTPFPESPNLSHTFAGEDLKLLDAASYDFRPQADSPLVDAGLEIPGFTEGSKGRAPDIGAYEHGGEHWRAGHCNGLWISAPTEEKPTVRVALLMPPLTAVRLDAPGAALHFTPDNWMQPQPVKLDAAAARFSVKSWGAVQVADLRTIPAEGLRLWFPQPDIVKSAPIDLRFNTDYFPDKREPKRNVAPTAVAFVTDKAITVDGRVGRDEWPASRNLQLRSLSNAERVVGDACVLRDGANLYVAICIRAKPEAGDRWGKSHGVEVDFQPVLGRKLGPVFVLHGFPSGRLESVIDAGATEEQAAAMSEAAKFAANVQGSSWSAELAIPLSALDAGRPLEKLLFNIGARVGAGDDGEWFAWAKTGSANYAVDRAGELALAVNVPVGAKNLLRNGDFEAADLKPWRKSNNAGKNFDAQVVGRVREGADDSWCARIECRDAKLMETGVLKCLQSLRKGLGAGTYVLSYDVRITGLKPIAKSGMFCGYIRTQSDVGAPRKGTNAGQMPHAIAVRHVPWTHRDCVIEVPEGHQPTFVSLQLHKATGTVWLDNVALMKAE